MFALCHGGDVVRPDAIGKTFTQGLQRAFARHLPWAAKAVDDGLGRPCADADSAGGGQTVCCIIMEKMTQSAEPCVDLFRRFLRNLRDLRDQRNKPTADWVAAFHITTSAIVEGLVNVESNDCNGDVDDDGGDYGDDGDDEKNSTYSHWQNLAPTKPVKAALEADLLNALRTLKGGELRKIAVTNIVARSGVFDPGMTVVPALTLLHPRQAHDSANDNVFMRLWMHAGAFLLKRSEHSPTVPMNWRQDVKPACTCVDCRA